MNCANRASWLESWEKDHSVPSDGCFAPTSCLEAAGLVRGRRGGAGGWLCIASRPLERQHTGTARVTRPASSSGGETVFGGVSGSGQE